MVSKINFSIILFWFSSISISYAQDKFELETIFKGHQAKISCLKFDNLQKLASGDKQGNIIIWDIVKHQKMYTLTGHKGQITDLKFSKNNKLLLTASYDGTVKLWDVTQQKCLKTFENPPMPKGGYSGRNGKELSFALFSHDETEIYFGGYNMAISKANPKTGKVSKLFVLGNENYAITCGILSPDRKHIIFGYGGCVAFLNISSKQITKKFGKHTNQNDFVCEIDLSSTGRNLGIWTYAGSIRQWEHSGENEFDRIQATKLQGSNEFKYSPTGEFIIYGHAHLKAHIVNPQSGQVIQVLEHEKGYAKALDITKNSDYIATEDNDMIRLWHKSNEDDPYEINKRDTVNLLLRFEQSSPVLLSESFPKLDKVLNYMEVHPTVVIRLEGHTDNVGDSTKNLNLSQQRAIAAKNYLLNKGIKETRIKTIGHGSKYPIASNEQEINRKHNRRVELVILSR